MASLLGMPVEVQWQIFHRLLHAHAENENSESRPYGDTWESTLVHHTALGNLSGTCKHLNATTAPLLYQRVNVSICYPATFILVLRHFSRFPKHAAFVRDLTIDSDYTCSPCSKSQRYFLVQEAYRLGLDLSFKSNGRWPQFGSLLIDVALCHLYAIQKLKLILPLITSSNEEWCPVSPNEANPFRSVEFEYASRLPPRLFCALCNALLKTLLPLKKTIRNLDLDCSTIRARNIKELDQLSHFKALRSLRLLFGYWHAGDNAALVNKFPPHLESLCVGASDIPVDDLAILLSACIRAGRLANLRRFEYTFLVAETTHPFPAGGEGISQEGAAA